MTPDDAFTIIGTALFSIGGGGAIIFGLSSWLGKVWAGRILEQDRARYQDALQKELERIRGEREKNVFVHRVQFEAEFKGYQEIWEHLAQCIASALSLRPMLDQRPVDKSEDEVRQERLAAFYASFSSAVRALRRHKPFLAGVLDKPVEELLEALRGEAIEFEHGDRHARDYWEAQRRNSADIQKKAEDLCALIRERIGLLVVVEDGQ